MKTEVNNYDDQEVRNLPVLYTIPKWSLVRRLGPNPNNTYYYVLELDKWIHMSTLGRELKKLGKSTQEYYDRWFLNIIVPSDRPKCSNPNCGREARFLALYRGYSKWCYNPDTGKPYPECNFYLRSEVQNRPEVRSKKIEAYADPVVKAKMAAGGAKVDHKDPEYIAKMRISVKEAKNRPEVKARRKATDALPETRARRSAAARKAAPQISATNKLTFSNPEVKAARKAQSKAVMSDPEVRRKIGEKNAVSVSKAWEEGKYDNRAGRLGIKCSTTLESGEVVSFDSTYEKRFFDYSLSDEFVVTISRSKHRVPYFITKEQSERLSTEHKYIKEGFHTYYPDFTIIRSSGVEELVEVKADYLIDNEIVTIKRNAAIQYCKEHHLIHYTVTEKFLESHNEEDIYYHVREDDWI